MTEAFHDEPVCQLKLHLSHLTNSTREFCILYQKVVIVIEAFGLFTALRACRNYLAKGIDSPQNISCLVKI